MFKQVEMWVVYLILLFSLLFAVGFGALVRQELVGETKLGNMSRTALGLAEIPYNVYRILTLNQDLILEPRFEGKTGFVGKPNEQEAYLLLSRYDGDIYQSVVDLVDLKDFKTLHTWNPDITALNNMVDQTRPEFIGLNDHKNEVRGRNMHPLLDADGGIIFQDTAPLNKIGYCSDIIWQNNDERFHHSLERDHEGNLWTGSYPSPALFSYEPLAKNSMSYRDDAITKLSPEGKMLYQKSLTQLFIDNDMKYLLFSMLLYGFWGDPLHMNDVQPVLEDGPHWKQGDLFISLRHQSMVFLFRPSTDEIIWVGVGHYYNQHDVDILNDHQIAVLNNKSINMPEGTIVEGHNEVTIYDFETKTYSSHLKDSLAAQDVRTITEGRSEILNDGDLFFEETNYGRALYYNKDGSLQWEYVNRAENGNLYLLNWSRILYKPDDLAMIHNILENKKDCP